MKKHLGLGLEGKESLIGHEERVGVLVLVIA